jgi:tyrosine-protein phosphatase SIW14
MPVFRNADSIAGLLLISPFRTALRSVQTFASRAWVLAALMTLVSGCAAPPEGIALKGTPNFHQINSRLYRSAQPSLEGVSALAGSGIKTVINLRMGDDILPQEEETAKAAGMTYRNVPLSGWRRPTDAQVNAVLSLIESSTPPVLVHCERGADRTGTIIACYRIRYENWPAERALVEAKSLGMAWIEFGMKDYIRDFVGNQPAP